METREDRRGPGLRFPPPLLPVALLVCAWLAEERVTLPISGNRALLLPGLALLSIALLMALAALVQFIRAKTQVEPWHPTSSIIQTGLFAYSRNPIYLAFCIATLGGALLLDSWWGIAAAAALVCLLQVLVIRKEETYLQGKFGDAYRDYRRRVRRWL